MKARRAIPPHRILLDADVLLDHEDAWLVGCNGENQPVASGGVIEHWQPGMHIRTSNVVRLAPSATEGLGGEGRVQGLRLGAVVTATTAGGLQLVTRTQRAIPLSGEPVQLDLVLDGNRLARNVTLTLAIVVLRPAAASDRLAPTLSGARLWAHSWRARIEGGRARLAMEAVAFSQLFASARLAQALVHVSVAEDGDLDIEQALTVYLNSEIPGFVQDVANRDPKASVVLADAVVRRVIAAGLDGEFDLRRDYEPASIGRQWQAWVASIFPGRGTADLDQMRRSDPSGYESRIQAWVRMGRAWG